MSSTDRSRTAESPETREARRELSVLWAQSHSIVLGYIRSVVIDFHQAEDVLQETAATAAERFEDYDRSRPFVPWVLGIARYKVLAALRSVSRDRLVFDEEVVTALATSFVESEPPVSDVQIALERCVSQVQGRPKKLLEMRYLRGQSALAVATATGMTAGAVAVALHRIRKALLECVERQMAAGNEWPQGEG